MNIHTKAVAINAPAIAHPIPIPAAAPDDKPRCTGAGGDAVEVLLADVVLDVVLVDCEEPEEVMELVDPVAVPVF